MDSRTLGAVGAVLAGASPMAFAQQTSGLEEIIVTAERRETALQDTPISVAAFTAETMELQGHRDPRGHCDDSRRTSTSRDRAATAT